MVPPFFAMREALTTAQPVWKKRWSVGAVVPAAKAVGKYVVTNAGPTLVQMTKKYGPVALRGYREHGLKPKKIFEFVLDEVAPGVHEVAVHWGLDEVRVLRNLGVKKVPSPITARYNWPGRWRIFTGLTQSRPCRP